jgi:L-ascorbate metabolism protein UlaG (beta-lactamase superfamily)
MAHIWAVQITFIGHATLLLEIGGTRILTDPNFESRLGFLLPRVTAPGLAIDKLGRLDALLLTHAHADHLSFKSLDLLPREIPLFAPPVVAEWLARKGYRHVVPLAPGEQVAIGDRGLRLHAASATHRGHRYGFDRWRSAANMYLMETDDESVFFAGDTAMTDSTHALVERVLWSAQRQLDVALLPIGWAPRWKEESFRKGHLTCDDALALFGRLHARAMMPYHWGTFRHVTASAYDAIDRLRASLREFPERERVHVIEPGESLTVPPAGTP